MRRYLSLLGLLTVLLLAGCGGGSHPASPPSHQQSCRTPQGVVAHACAFGHEKAPNLKALAPTATPTVEMFDSIQANIPRGARVAAGYTSGNWPTFGLFVRIYPHVRIISIAIGAGYQAHCLDVEPGDASPSQVVFWVRFMRGHGNPKPCVYASLSTWYESIFSNLAGAGIARSAIWKWDAHYDYFAHIDAGFDATQWTDHAYGQNLDESTVTLAFAELVKPAPPRLHCFGPQAKVRNPTCRRVRRQVFDGPAGGSGGLPLGARGALGRTSPGPRARARRARACACDQVRRDRLRPAAADGGRDAQRLWASGRRVCQRRLRRRARLLADTPEHWREMVLTNVLGPALTLRATIPALTETRGHLLLTSSVAGRRPLPGSLYSAIRHAVTAMGEAARQDLNGTGVRVTLIEPGMVGTPFFDDRPESALEAEDVARAVLYAVSQPAHVDVNEILIRPVTQQG